MKKSVAIRAGIVLGLIFILPAQEAAAQDQSVQALADLDVMLQALEATTPVPANSLPQTGNFWSAQHAPGSREAWPPLPGNMLGLEAWPLGNGVYLLNDTNVNYEELRAENEVLMAAQAALSKKKLPRGGGKSPMFSSINNSGGTPVYITNFVAVPTNGSMTVTFSIVGGTNGIAYDIYGTSNLTNSPVYSQWVLVGTGLYRQQLHRCQPAV